MLHRLVQSAFQTGFLSVESEGLIRQMLTIRSYQPADLAMLQTLQSAIYTGQIQREAKSNATLFVLPHNRLSPENAP